jgi:hypothetical protein
VSQRGDHTAAEDEPQWREFLSSETPVRDEAPQTSWRARASSRGATRALANRRSEVDSEQAGEVAIAVHWRGQTHRMHMPARLDWVHAKDLINRGPRIREVVEFRFETFHTVHGGQATWSASRTRRGSICTTG